MRLAVGTPLHDLRDLPIAAGRDDILPTNTTALTPHVAAPNTYLAVADVDRDVLRVGVEHQVRGLDRSEVNLLAVLQQCAGVASGPDSHGRSSGVTTDTRASHDSTTESTTITTTATNNYFEHKRQPRVGDKEEKKQPGR